ncbi:Outer membrane protein beta-barrel domain-containing protein [Cyclobacterium xiamenense]|uniref:Outer membrane protein beta-barrel domain-containing protein n=1 Tax=Cyclobacterium xiamenense TaxID=1297121 RepID=A0A1H7B4T6_9BACT|nr:porin family protein [Cyclobacterium xiamenense]SEJ68425.1 Outer membrane protein beta-barrel domain-containing protein [Cyclobacterium xiamenense]
MRQVIHISLALLLLSLISGEVRAQEFSIGPKIGISQGNISVTGSTFSKGNEKLGYHAGIFARLGGNRIFIQPEILYSNTGGEFEHMQSNNQVTYTASFDRIDVPLMAGFKFANFFRIQAGPSLTFILDNELSTQDPLLTIASEPNTTTLGYQAGIGLDIANMILDFKYEGALANHVDSIAGLPTDQRQNQLILSLGIRLF